MANIKVNCADLQQVLEMTPATHNIMLVGNHGIGKSEILTHYFSGKAMRVVALFLGQMSDPGDILGLPQKDESTGKTVFMPPYWFPTDGQPVVLFLDELNRARPEILQTVMDLALNRKLAGRSLPEGSRIISAVNEGSQYQLTDLDPALVSRFNVLLFQPTVQEWLLWAKENKVDNRVMTFIEENPIWLDHDPDSRQEEDTGLDKTPDRRAWKRVSDIIKGQDSLSTVTLKVLASIVGTRAAAIFANSIANHKMVSGKEVLFSLEKVMDTLEEYAPHELSTVNDCIFRTLETEKIDKTKKDTAAQNLLTYFDMLCKEHREAAAHFCTLYTGTTYSKATAWIAKENRKLSSRLLDFVTGLK